MEFNLFGLEEEPNIEKIIRNLQKGLITPLPNSENERSMKKLKFLQSKRLQDIQNRDKLQALNEIQKEKEMQKSSQQIVQQKSNNFSSGDTNQLDVHGTKYLNEKYPDLSPINTMNKNPSSFLPKLLSPGREQYDIDSFTSNNQRSRGNNQRFNHRSLPATEERGMLQSLKALQEIDKQFNSRFVQQDNLLQISRKRISNFIEKKLVMKQNQIVQQLIAQQRAKHEYYGQSPVGQASLNMNQQVKIGIQRAPSLDTEQFKDIIEKVDMHKQGEFSGANDRGRLKYLSQISSQRHNEEQGLKHQLSMVSGISQRNQYNLTTNPRSLQQIQLEQLMLKKKRIKKTQHYYSSKAGRDQERSTSQSPEAQRLYQEFKQKMRKETEQRKKDEEDAPLQNDNPVPVIATTDKDQANKFFDENASERIELKKFIKWEKDGAYTIDKISAKDPDIRTTEEKLYFMMFLKFRVPFFKAFQKEVLNMLTERFLYKLFQNREMIMKKGDDGDCMYVIIRGQVGIYIDQELKNCIVTLGENKVFGERALETDDKRGATILSHESTHCLVLYKNDYRSVVYHVKMIQKSQRQNFLMQVPFFKDWSYIKILEFNNLLHEQKYSANDIIYEIGTKPEVFYILKTGRLALETIVEIEDQNSYPVGKNQWEVCTTKKQILYKVREIKPGDFFGHEEMILEMEANKQDNNDPEPVMRKCRVRALGLSDLIYLNKNDFFSFFIDQDLEHLKAQAQLIEKDEIVNRIRKNKFIKKQINQAILNATQINYIPSVVGIQGSSGMNSQRNFVNSREKKIQKLQPWFEKVKSNKTVSPSVIREDEKIKILNITKNKVIVDEKKRYISEYLLETSNAVVQDHQDSLFKIIE